jgi:V8-like Glu-specific endopeptidase
LYQIQEEDMKNDIFHKSIVALVIENNSLEVRASGVLISPDLVLTSAHNLFDHKTKMEAKTVNCYIGVNGISKKIYNTDDFYYPKKFKSTNSAEYDYALIKLKDKVTEVEHNFLSLALFFNDLKASLAIFGYPCKDDDNFKVINQNGDER